MKSYNEFQVKQLTRLIEVTRTSLSRADRQKARAGRRRGGGVSALFAQAAARYPQRAAVHTSKPHAAHACQAMQPPTHPAPQTMNMITIDAHSRDMVANIVEAGETRADCFLWMCQLRSTWDAKLGDCR